MSSLNKIATTAELQPGAGKKVEINGKEIAVFNIGGHFYAIDDMCPHRGGSLSEGSCEEKVVACPWHGWQYDVTTGSCLTNPSVQQQTYEVKVQGNDLFISA
jgi:nitrite reductase (NADH) small subunit/3-phenylpropionate/trans-cinnamate dioxygenase ferredoxin subunit